MDEEKKKLLDTFQKLDPLNRAEVIVRASLILTIQESTKRQMLERLFSSPEYADYRPTPMGAVLAGEAVNA
jgi:hypothetical protein